MLSTCDNTHLLQLLHLSLYRGQVNVAGDTHVEQLLSQHQLFALLNGRVQLLLRSRMCTCVCVGIFALKRFRQLASMCRDVSISVPASFYISPPFVTVYQM